MAYRARPEAAAVLSFTTGWVGDVSPLIAVVGLLLMAAGAFMFSSRNESLRVSCDGDVCLMMRPEHNDSMKIPVAGNHVVLVDADRSGGNQVDGTYFVRVMGDVNATIPATTHENAEAMARALRDGKKRDETFRIGEGREAPALFFGLLWFAFVLAFAIRRALYRIAIDPELNEIQVDRARGFGPAARVRVPLADIEKLGTAATRPDSAFSYHRVVAVMRDGDETVLVPVVLKKSIARAIAELAAALIEEVQRQQRLDTTDASDC